MGRKKPRLVENLQVIDIGDKGMSIAKGEDGRVHLLRGGVPGDVVTALIRRKKKGMPFGDVETIQTASPDRVEPFCSHFDQCGGCKWQDLDYKSQLHFKEKQVHDAIRRIAHITDYEARPIVPCSRTREFRNKLEFTFSPRRWLSYEEIRSDVKVADRRTLGFHLPGAWDKILDIKECHLMEGIHNRIRNTFLAKAKEENIAFYDPVIHFGILRNLMIRMTTLGEIMVVLILSEDIPDVNNRLLDPMIAQFPEVTSWHTVLNDKPNDSLTGLNARHYAGEKHIRERLGNKEFIISPLSFFQTNSYQANVLYDIVANYADLQGDEVIYDLYCGAGTIGLYLAQSGQKIIGVEQNPAAIEDAWVNAQVNDCPQAYFAAGDVVEVVDQSFVKEHGQPDLVICDPPRAGMAKEFVDFLLELNSERIIYVSCNPSTQARDLQILASQYQLIECTPVDMFPHTSHIESVALLRRR